MNETIKKILSNAKDYTMCNDPALLHHAISGVFVEKFAELIIRECVAEAKDECAGWTERDQCLVMQVMDRNMIHFGVKE